VRVSGEIIAAEREHSLGVTALSVAERDRIRGRVRSLYGERRRWMWESLPDPASVQDPDAWQWIEEFVGDRECVLLFDVDEDEEMFSVPSGAALDALLGNTCGFEFYVTDRNATYLICFNHHDFLVCCGAAKAWLLARDEERMG
jgi:hypothetical protein